MCIIQSNRKVLFRDGGLQGVVGRMFGCDGSRCSSCDSQTLLHVFLDAVPMFASNGGWGCMYVYRYVIPVNRL